MGGVCDETKRERGGDRGDSVPSAVGIASTGGWMIGLDQLCSPVTSVTTAMIEMRLRGSREIFGEDASGGSKTSIPQVIADPGAIFSGRCNLTPNPVELLFAIRA